MKRTLDDKKLYLKYGDALTRANSPSNHMDTVVIGYSGIGEAVVPPSLYSSLVLMGPADAYKLLSNPKRVLFEAIKHSQYMPFEEIKTRKQ